jgi:hypothetical protein
MKISKAPEGRLRVTLGTGATISAPDIYRSAARDEAQQEITQLERAAKGEESEIAHHRTRARLFRLAVILREAQTDQDGVRRALLRLDDMGLLWHMEDSVKHVEWPQHVTPEELDALDTIQKAIYATLGENADPFKLYPMQDFGEELWSVEEAQKQLQALEDIGVNSAASGRWSFLRDYLARMGVL